ncbi:MAG: DNA/RNA non-specific endonuclease, partial [Burkholderiales bacterium]
MVPQVHANNAGIWAGIEGAVRQLAIDEGELYVVTGPAFIGSDVQRIGRVLVPTYLWKVVYSPRQRKAGAYLITNDATKEYSAVSVAQLEAMVGIDALPGLASKIRDSAMTLPKPKSVRGSKRKAPQEDEFNLRELSRGLLDAVECMFRK